ncbi:MAG: hypothetical protein ACTS73_03775 [Arsenophonus sp. NEOnobi-MAG3]
MISITVEIIRHKNLPYTGIRTKADITYGSLPEFIRNTVRKLIISVEA